MSDMGFAIAATGLSADTAQLDTASNNLANVNTPGYAAEQVNLVPEPASGPFGSGQGVLIGSISRLTDAVFAAAKVSAEGASSAANQTKQVMSSIESIFPEPSSTGIASQFSALWSDLSTLAANPNQAGAQQTVVSAAQTLTNSISDSFTQLANLSSSLQSQVGTGANGGGSLAQVNGLLAQVAQLNGGIAQGSAGGQNVNSLLDQSSAIVDKLAGLIGVTTSSGANGMVSVYVNGIQLVSGDVAQKLSATGSAATHNLGITTSFGASVDAKGSIGAMISAVNSTIPSYVSQLNSVADSLANQMNNLQANGMDANGDPGSAIAPSGYTGTILPNIFVNSGSSTTYTSSSPGFDSAATIAVSPTLAANVSLIATASAPGPNNSNVIGQPTLDGSNAQAMAALGSSPSGPAVVYQNMIGMLGTQTVDANNVAASAAALATTAKNNLSAISGVHMNAEELKVMSAQNAYQAVTRVISAMNSSLQSLIQAV